MVVCAGRMSVFAVVITVVQRKSKVDMPSDV